MRGLAGNSVAFLWTVFYPVHCGGCKLTARPFCSCPRPYEPHARPLDEKSFLVLMLYECLKYLWLVTATEPQLLKH